MAIKIADVEFISQEIKEFLNIDFKLDKEHFGGVALAEENTRVSLIYAPEWHKWADAAFYAAFATWNNEFEVNLDKIPAEQRDGLLLEALKKRPISAVLESAVFIFKIDNIPRSMTHQLVRARFAAFNQESYRVMPAHHADLRVTEEMGQELTSKASLLADDARELYLKMIEVGVPIEHARNILPMGTCTHIVMTASLKVFIDYIKARTLSIAQDEHTFIACLMLQELKRKQPFFFRIVEQAVPNISTIMLEYLRR